MELETLHIFESYSLGRMQEQERRDFELRLDSEAGFRDEFEEYLHIVNGVEAFERARLKRFITDKNVRSMYAGGGWSSLRRVAAAAAVILILMIPGYIIFRTTTYHSRLAKEYHFEDPGLPVTMGAAGNPLLDQAMIEFKDHQFEASLAVINKLLSLNPANDTLNYYAGMCYFETAKNEEALGFLKKISDKESKFYYKARYSEALIYIRTDQLEEARTNLEIVSRDEAGALQDKAKELLTKI